MYANDFAALGTFPSSHFLFHEFSYAILPYVPEIINHAHSVFCSVSCVETVQTVTGELRALEAMPRINTLEHFTLFYPA
jgi:hypothetical protein